MTITPLDFEKIYIFRNFLRLTLVQEDFHLLYPLKCLALFG